jgi:hypothetical protein
VTVTVGTLSWYAWLETATTFAFEGSEGTFTAHKVRAGNRRGGWYWRAYRRYKGRLSNCYLGVSANLTLPCLCEAASRLATRSEDMGTRDETEDESQMPASPDILTPTLILNTKFALPRLPIQHVSRPPLLSASEDTSDTYGSWQWAKGGGRGQIGGSAFIMQNDGTLRCLAGATLWFSELRQENVFTQRAVFLASMEDCQRCTLREQCLRPGARGNRARRLSAVRRLLPIPATVELQTGVLPATRWRDVPGRALRRTWATHWRRQFVEVLSLTAKPQRASPPPRSPRAIRSHQRWSWEDRLARNAWWGPPNFRVTVAGVPSSLAVS